MPTIASIPSPVYSRQRSEAKILCIELVMEQQAMLERENERDLDLIHDLLRCIKQRQTSIDSRDDLAPILEREQTRDREIIRSLCVCVKERQKRIEECREFAAHLESMRPACERNRAA